MRENTIALSNHFTYRKLLQYTLPSIVMVIFASLYSVVDELASAVAIAFIIKNKNRYGYL